MKGGAILPVVLAGLTPVLLLGLLASGVGLGLVAWRPPLLWMNTLGGSIGVGDTAVLGVDNDSSGVYTAWYSNYSGIGYPGGHLLISKYDFLGGTVWTHTLGNSTSTLLGISVGTDGLYLVGNNIGPSAGFLEKFDLAGNRVWTTNSSIGGGISAIASGVYLAGGSTITEYDLAGKLLWTSHLFNATGTTMGGVVGVFADSSGVYVAGDYSGNLTGQGQNMGENSFLVKYGLNGGMAWARQFGTKFDRTYSVSAGSTGVYVSGTTYLGSLTAFGWLRKFDSSGNLNWMMRIDSPDGSGAGDSSISSRSGVYVSLSTVAGHDYLMNYDPRSGQQVWSFSMGNAREIYGVGLAYRLDATSDAVYVAGSIPENGYSTGFVSSVSKAASLVMFGLNPPLSFVVLGGIIGGSTMCLVLFRRLQRKRAHPPRQGPPPSSLPATD